MITLKTLPQATTQEIFDQVAIHLFTQNKQSKSDELGKCAYRGDNGLKCAAGCLIADDEYQQGFDNANLVQELTGTTWNSLAEAGLVPREHCNFIRELQRIHDGVKPEEWKGYLLRLAKINELSVDAIHKFEQEKQMSL